jgi:FMN-dependent NADH-azoreductase
MPILLHIDSSPMTGELLDADEYVIGVPMHNWGPSSSFKL